MIRYLCSVPFYILEFFFEKCLFLPLVLLFLPFTVMLLELAEYHCTRESKFNSLILWASYQPMIVMNNIVMFVAMIAAYCGDIASKIRYNY